MTKAIRKTLQPAASPNRLTTLEAQIQQGIDLTEQGRSLIWKAVAEVHGSELWSLAIAEGQPYTSFEDYSKRRWGWEKSNAFEVAAAGRVVAELKASGIPDSALPTSVSQVRPLVKLDPKQQVQIWRQLTASGTRATAQAVKAAIAKKSAPTNQKAKQAPAIEVPAVGVPDDSETLSPLPEALPPSVIQLKPSASLEDCITALAQELGGMQAIALAVLAGCDDSELLTIYQWIAAKLGDRQPIPADSEVAPAPEPEPGFIKRALLYLSASCGGAKEKDGAGFNGVDAPFGRTLAALVGGGSPLTPRHAELALKMLQKYAKQLAKGGIILPDWAAVKAGYQAAPKQITIADDDEYRMVLSGSRILLFSPYDGSGNFQRLAKTIEDYKFEREPSAHWSFPASAIATVLEKFEDYEWEQDPAIAIEVEHQKVKAQQVIEAQEQAALQKSEHILELLALGQFDQPLENGWYLRDYQRKGAEWLLAHSVGGIFRGGILADEMGLGKTLEALAAAKVLQKKHNCPVFVICPVSLLDNWHKEAAIAGVEIECFSWAKVPYPLESAYVLVADESHYAQNDKASRTKKLLVLAGSSHCIATWLLTGTPMKNGQPVNLLPLLSAIAHPLADDRWAYMKRYCSAHQKSVGCGKQIWDFSGSAYLQELSQKTEDAILRRTKAECLAELPEKTRILRPIELESANQKAYDAEIKRLVRDYKTRAERGEVDPDAEALVTLNILRKVGSIAKVPAGVEFAQSILEQGEQVVIFTEFLESAHAIHAALGGELLTGASKDRQAIVDRFQSGEAKVFVGTIKAGGVGITLTSASQVILVDRPWTPGDTAQCEDRVHRLGQQSACFAYWLQLGDIDQAIDTLLQDKSDRIELILKGKRRTLRGLDSPKELAKELLAML